MFAPQQLRVHWRRLHRGRPGHRFQDWYERARSMRHRLGPMRRIAMFLVAVLCLAIGLVLTVFPGPAIPFLTVAGALLALESRDVARLMDWMEIRIRHVWRWLYGIWVSTPALGRVALLLVAGSMSATLTYFVYRFVRS